MEMVTADDKLIWSLGTGTTLRAKKDMFMEDDGEHVFTQGKVYRVESMHPIAEPAYVVVKNDHGDRHRFYAEHIREYFTPKVELRRGRGDDTTETESESV